jgi:hypothetical protein
MVSDRTSPDQAREDRYENEGEKESSKKDEVCVDLQVMVNGLCNEIVPDRDTADDSVGEDNDGKHQVPA